MNSLNSESKISSTSSEINDDILIDFFCNLLKKKKIQFLKDIQKFDIYDEEIDELNDENEYKDIDDEKLQKILKNLTLNNKSDDAKIEILKKKKIIFQKLWPHFIRNAIRYLRFKDLRDRGNLKFDFGVKNLMDYFMEFSSFEELLFGIDEYYRDHSSHVFRVYLSGEFIVRKFLSNDYGDITIFDQPEKKIENEEIIKYLKISKGEKGAIWCIIALCHDLGYPLQKIYNLNEKLSNILKYFGIYNFERVRFNLPQEGTMLNEYIIKILSSKLVYISDDEFDFKVQSKFYTKFSNAYEKLNHGILSCVLLMKNLVFFKETDFKKNISKDKDKNYHINAKQYLLRREILRAIASHDCLDIYHINAYNYPFLLIICDEIQEWNRPFSKKRIQYGWESDKSVVIQINSFNHKSIELSMKIDLKPHEMKEYAEDKIRRFIRLLRSAVDSYKREFNFKMIIENNSNLKFEFIYTSPNEFYINNPFSFESPMYYNKPQVIKYENGIVDKDYLAKIIKI